jgi:hypothetical protein
MTRRARMAVACAIVLAAAAALRAKVGLAFLPPHAVRPAAAMLDPALAARVDGALAGARIESADDAIDFALDRTGELLHFGLGHATRLRFGVDEREGNCIEYAHLFATVFNRAAVARGLDARARVVHSGRARVFGRPENHAARAAARHRQQPDHVAP